MLELGSKIQSQVQSEVGKNQREYFLREQMKAIQKELGEGDEQAKEIDELREKIEAAGMPEDVKKEALRELDRLSKMPAGRGRVHRRAHLHRLARRAALGQAHRRSHRSRRRPRTCSTRITTASSRSKDRILEYLAVRKLKPDMKGPILCFVGPPGVGKTSLAQVDRHVARPQVRAHVARRHARRGRDPRPPPHVHRRAARPDHPGPAPRRVAATRCSCSTRSTSSARDFRGDPASALLEVLDPEQNNTFRDHYLDVPFDLSRGAVHHDGERARHDSRRRCATAWKCSSCPATPRRRSCASRAITWSPRQVANHGLTRRAASRSPTTALRAIIRGYTREAGVRNLEREIGADLPQDRAPPRRRRDRRRSTVTPAGRRGAPRRAAPPRRGDGGPHASDPGVAIGLAWTPVGGDVLFVEASRMAGGSSSRSPASSAT